ncbi:MAG: hypothetical protein Q7R96_04795 [Nanoarchaeota archaeon]|nr:hypothetical protein [Nanoarchaeota archaeon]
MGSYYIVNGQTVAKKFGCLVRSVLLAGVGLGLYWAVPRAIHEKQLSDSQSEIDVCMSKEDYAGAREVLDVYAETSFFSSTRVEEHRASLEDVIVKYKQNRIKILVENHDVEWAQKTLKKIEADGRLSDEQLLALKEQVNSIHPDRLVERADVEQDVEKKIKMYADALEVYGNLSTDRVMLDGVREKLVYAHVAHAALVKDDWSLGAATTDVGIALRYVGQLEVKPKIKSSDLDAIVKADTIFFAKRFGENLDGYSPPAVMNTLISYGANLEQLAALVGVEKASPDVVPPVAAPLFDVSLNGVLTLPVECTPQELLDRMKNAKLVLNATSQVAGYHPKLDVEHVKSFAQRGAGSLEAMLDYKNDNMTFNRVVGEISVYLEALAGLFSLVPELDPVIVIKPTGDALIRGVKSRFVQAEAPSVVSINCLRELMNLQKMYELDVAEPLLESYVLLSQKFVENKAPVLLRSVLDQGLVFTHMLPADRQSVMQLKFADAYLSSYLMMDPDDRAVIGRFIAATYDHAHVPDNDPRRVTLDGFLQDAARLQLDPDNTSTKKTVDPANGAEVPILPSPWKRPLGMNPVKKDVPKTEFPPGTEYPPGHR